jgi:hypothetical protein
MAGSEDFEYEFAWWLRANDRAQLDASIERIASLAGLAPLASPKETLQALIATMPQPGLVVFDDAESWDQVKAYVEATGASHVVVTTASDSPSGVRVGGLHPDAAVLDFVAERAQLSVADAEALVEAVDGLPLLLLHACQFIVKTNSTVDEYLELLERPSALFESWPYQAPDYDRPRLRVIPIGVLRLASESDRWHDLCAVLASVAPAPIPIAVLQSIDADADAFLSDAQSAFLLTLDRRSETVEVPTLIRNALLELGIPSDDPEVHRRIWNAIADIPSDVVRTHFAYLAEHVIQLGLDPGSIVAATRLGHVGGSGALQTRMRRHAYRSAQQIDAAMHRCERAALATTLGWALWKQGGFLDGGRILRGELDLANEAGCISCRGPLLHVLGHFAESELSPEAEAYRTFHAAESAMRICRQRDSEYGQVLADVIFSCVAGINFAKRSGKDWGVSIFEFKAEGTRGVEELASLKEDLLPLGSSAVRAADLNRWTRAIKAWDVLNKALSDGSLDQRQQAAAEDEEKESEAEPPPLSELFVRCVTRLIPRLSEVDDLERIDAEIQRLEQQAASPEERDAAAAALREEARTLRVRLVERFGPESHAVALADLIEVIAAHSQGDERLAAAACRRFVAGMLGATDVMTTRLALIQALLRTRSVPLGRTHDLLIEQIPWMVLAPEVEAFIWLLDGALSEEEGAAPRRNVHRAIEAVSRLGSSGMGSAALLAHLFAHKESLSERDSLHFHRIAVRMYVLVGMPAPDWGYALYCYAHSLLQLDLAEAAERRFIEARNMLTMVDSGSKTVAHIDEHLSSEVAPYLADE